jgi:hypothetical protein
LGQQVQWLALPPGVALPGQQEKKVMYVNCYVAIKVLFFFLIYIVSSLVLTHCRRLCLEQSIGLLPVTISSSRTPKANMSVFSSTMPFMKYSGAKYLLKVIFETVEPIWILFTLLDFYQVYHSYPNVPSIGMTE